jgi:GT2 family glycosyltransferase
VTTHDRRAVSGDPRISVIIPTHQRRASLDRALRSLERQSLSHAEYEVIVAIDGSTDGTRELVEGWDRTESPRITSMWKPRGGRASACNAGLRLAAAPIVVFLDDDMEATPGLLAGHLAAHAGAARLGVVGAVPIRVGASSTSVTRYVASRFNGHLRNLAEPGYEFGLRDFYSGNFSVARDAIAAIGGFDEAFAVYGNEDLELSLRLRANGVRLVFSADAMAYQHYEKDFAALARDTREKGRTAVQLARKHPSAAPDLKLSQFDRGPRASRLARNTLLAAGARWTRTSHVVVRAISWLGDRRMPGLHRVYPVALDYLYWSGVRAAQGSGDAVAAANEPTTAPVQ